MSLRLGLLTFQMHANLSSVSGKKKNRECRYSGTPVIEKDEQDNTVFLFVFISIKPPAFSTYAYLLTFNPALYVYIYSSEAQSGLRFTAVP